MHRTILSFLIAILSFIAAFNRVDISLLFITISILFYYGNGKRSFFSYISKSINRIDNEVRIRERRVSKINVNQKKLNHVRFSKRSEN